MLLQRRREKAIEKAAKTVAAQRALLLERGMAMEMQISVLTGQKSNLKKVKSAVIDPKLSSLNPGVARTKPRCGRHNVIPGML